MILQIVIISISVIILIFHLDKVSIVSIDKQSAKKKSEDFHKEMARCEILVDRYKSIKYKIIKHTHLVQKFILIESDNKRLLGRLLDPYSVYNEKDILGVIDIMYKEFRDDVPEFRRKHIKKLRNDKLKELGI